ncbi:unnamed protein product [Blepharisma stoltei]|uniref:Uncharacterized protein n=1 Tax=Blepharisma stoltei TaxID=1481888 RepID=A0AAU9JB85_9CILI|nr:unnamed protein product [Blepharisma stoltei]
MKASKFSTFDPKILSASPKILKKRLLKNKNIKPLKKSQDKQLQLEVNNFQTKIIPIDTGISTFIHGNWNIRGHKLKAIYTSERKTHTPHLSGLFLNFTRPVTSSALPGSKLKHRRFTSAEVTGSSNIKPSNLARPITSFTSSKQSEDNTSTKIIHQSRPTTPIKSKPNEIAEEFSIQSPFVYKMNSPKLKITKRNGRTYTPYSHAQMTSNTPLQMTTKTPTDLEPRRKSLGLQVDDLGYWEFPEEASNANFINLL